MEGNGRGRGTLMKGEEEPKKGGEGNGYEGVKENSSSGREVTKDLKPLKTYDDEYH